MIRNSLFAPRRLGQLFSAAALACALAAPAHAGILDFEAPVDNPLVFSGDVMQIGQYYLEGAGAAGFVGAIGTSDACGGPQCPVNNATNYYTAFDDGYFIMGMADGSAFTLSSLDASFVGAGLATYPSTAALLYITAFDATGIVAEIYLDLAGPTGGNFSFASYDLSGFGGGAQFTDVRFASYACDGAGNCNRTTNQANFAIDNIATVDASAVPEPGTFALMGLGILGLVRSRRRAA